MTNCEDGQCPERVSNQELPEYEGLSDRLTLGFLSSPPNLCRDFLWHFSVASYNSGTVS